MDIRQKLAGNAAVKNLYVHVYEDGCNGLVRGDILCELPAGYSERKHGSGVYEGADQGDLYIKVPAGVTGRRSTPDDAHEEDEGPSYLHALRSRARTPHEGIFRDAVRNACSCVLVSSEPVGLNLVERLERIIAKEAEVTDEKILDYRFLFLCYEKSRPSSEETPFVERAKKICKAVQTGAAHEDIESFKRDCTGFYQKNPAASIVVACCLVDLKGSSSWATSAQTLEGCISLLEEI